MNPAVFLLLALLTPFTLLVTLLVPFYATIVGGCYLVYNMAATNPLSGKLLDVFYIIDVYTKLFGYWYDRKTSLSLIHYTLPVAVLPLAGLIFSLWLTRKLARKIKDIFHTYGSVH